jgi:hypothetical protein
MSPREAANNVHLPESAHGGSLEARARAASVNKDLLNTTAFGGAFQLNISNINRKIANAPLLEIEVLYRHNVLYSRAQLFKHRAHQSWYPLFGS